MKFSQNFLRENSFVPAILSEYEYDGIWAFPSTIERNDVKIPAIRFVIYPKRKYYSFGPAFLNHNK